MALIKCPECGRENVSDTANSCPNCGYCINAHFTQIKEKEIQKTKKEGIEKKRKESLAKYSAELEKEIEKIKAMPYPKKPTIISAGKSAIYLYLSILIGSFLLGFITRKIYLLSYIFAAICSLDLFIGTILLIVVIYADYNSEMHSYKYEIGISEETTWKDFEGYKKHLINKKIEYYSDKDDIDYRIAYRKIVNTDSKIKCPICNSINVERISTASRVISVEIVGLASNKIGKQYKCKNCKHLW